MWCYEHTSFVRWTSGRRQATTRSTRRRSEAPVPRAECGAPPVPAAPRVGDVEVLLVHPGGPFWARKDAGAWSIPKGEYDEGDDPATRAEEEFAEELGRRAAVGTAARSRRGASGGGKAGAGLGGARRPRHQRHHQQRVRDGMAAALRRTAQLPRGRQGGSGSPSTRPARKLLAGQLPLLERLESIPARAGALDAVLTGADRADDARREVQRWRQGMPPSTRSSWPVVKLEASLAKYRAVPTTSSGSPNRLRAMTLRALFERSPCPTPWSRR